RDRARWTWRGRDHRRPLPDRAGGCDDPDPRRLERPRGRRRNHRALAEVSEGVAAVTQENPTNALYGIAEEMAMVEYRSSFSPIIREMLDFNCGVFDEIGR